MEENICILMSDLSGYTALTETHGAASAADLIDRYVQLVESSLVGDSHLQERVGDEVMIISENPGFLFSTAVRILQHTAEEHNFLQIHGGLHYGPALKRRNSYFGSSINLTSRIAAKASPGTFWCSKEFVDSLSKDSKSDLHFMGKQNFKNISEEREMYELRHENKYTIFIDSVCRMLIIDTAQAVKHPVLNDVYFCSETCLDIHLRTSNNQV